MSGTQKTADGELHFAAARGDLDKCRELISRGYSVNDFDELGHTPLHYAVKDEQIEAAKLLLAAGANVNARDESKIGNTPLGEIAGNCSLEMAKLLVEAGADPSIAGWMQICALDLAAERKRGDGPAIYKLLRAATKQLPSRHCP
jgi:ankyrin repeat protein